MVNLFEIEKVISQFMLRPGSLFKIIFQVNDFNKKSLKNQHWCCFSWNE